MIVCVNWLRKCIHSLRGALDLLLVMMQARDYRTCNDGRKWQVRGLTTLSAQDTFDLEENFSESVKE